MTKARPRRSGVLLLVVLCVLVLLLLVGLAFYVSGATFARASKGDSRAHRDETPRKQFIDSALYQIIRDTRNRHSSIQGHSLLEDLYGRDGFAGVVENATAMADGQFQLVEIASSAAEPHTYDGCVFTPTTGLSRGQSGRVVQHRRDDTTTVFVVDGIQQMQRGDRFVVNGFPFNGQGAGSDGTNLDAAEANPLGGKLPHALLPHYRTYVNSISDIARGGLDESWDAIDYQNMFLAKVPLDPRRTIIPSFHRPHLISYWQQNSKGLFQQPNKDGGRFRSMVMLRPTGGIAGLSSKAVTDHPAFTAALGPFDPVAGPWDVDNDGDGIADSVWLDFGFPPVTASDGTLVKPLVAPLIVDLDGRLNVNAHGNWSQIQLSLSPFVRTLFPPLGKGRIPFAYPRGQGVGPAEVDLRAAFRGNLSINSKLFNLRYATSYGAKRERTGVQQPGRQGDSDGLPYGQATPEDAAGNGFVYLDNEGQPVWEDYAFGGENPYEVSLLTAQSADHTFAETDLEWLLRNHDPDRGKIRSRLQDVGFDPALNRLFTTASYSIPTLPRIGNAGIVSDFRKRLASHGVANLEMQLAEMLPPEILRGEKMDLNRVFTTIENGRAKACAPQGIPTNLLPPGTMFTEADKLQYVKGIYARHLYCLMMTLIPEGQSLTKLPGLDSSQAEHLLARQVAQWAVNVVDFRDADGVSTPFEFDVNPWDGWHTNGILKSDWLDPRGDTTESSRQRDVVWGMERPELLLTESLAFHNRMVGDFDIGNKRNPELAGTEADDDLDQIRYPHGPFLLEMRSPHSANYFPGAQRSWPQPIDTSEAASATSEGLYFQANEHSAPVLNMDKARIGAGKQLYSTWRVAISEWHGSQEKLVSPAKLADEPTSARAAMARFEPDRSANVTDRFGPQLRTERIIWFTSQSPETTHPDYGRIYRTETIPGFWPVRAMIPTGATAVVTPFANFTIGTGSRVSPPWIFHRATQKFVFNGRDSVIEFEDEEGRLTRHQAIPIMATSGDLQSADGTQVPSVGVSVTEPIPLDYLKVYGERTTVVRDTPADSHPGAPLSQHETLLTTHTDTNYKTAFLQRLANPAFGWNPPVDHPQHDLQLPVNPYLTVDWMPIPLSVFNSAMMPGEIGEWDPKDGEFDPDDPAFDDLDFDYNQRFNLASLEWTGKPQLADPVTAAFVNVGTGKEFSNFWGLFGTLNHQLATGKSQRPPVRLGHTIGASPGSVVEGSLEIPRPWIAWNNRPFSSHFELLDVPKSSAARFRFEYGLPDEKIKSFNHLLNFSESGDGTALHRIFDYVHVPSPFVRSSTTYNANAFQNVVGLRPPFHRRSNYRDPGKININTVFDERIWSAIGGDRFVPWEQVEQSMSGYDRLPAKDVKSYDVRLPAERTNPFRSSQSSDLMPLAPIHEPDPVAAAFGPMPPNWMRRQPVDASILRRQRFSAEPLFAQKYAESFAEPPIPGMQLRDDVTTDYATPRERSTRGTIAARMHNNPARNSYFYHQNLQKLGNVLTTQSNVYGIWLTVGFFELEPNYPRTDDQDDLRQANHIDAAHPDGWRLGMEQGSHSGQVERQRGFFIVDRSIPVAYEPGVNHNVDQMIKLRRYLE